MQPYQPFKLESALLERKDEMVDDSKDASFSLATLVIGNFRVQVVYWVCTTLSVAGPQVRGSVDWLPHLHKSWNNLIVGATRKDKTRLRSDSLCAEDPFSDLSRYCSSVKCVLFLLATSGSARCYRWVKKCLLWLSFPFTLSSHQICRQVLHFISLIVSQKQWLIVNSKWARPRSLKAVTRERSSLPVAEFLIQANLKGHYR